VTYTPQVWVDGAAGNTPIDAARLGYMETGIQNAHGLVQPADIGLVGWTGDPRAFTSNVTFSQGIEHFVRVWVPAVVPSLSRVVYGSATIGNTISAGFIVLRDSSGSLIAQWPDQATNFTTLTGRIIATLAAPLTNVPAGTYYVGIMFRGTTSPALYRSGQTGGLTAGALTTGPYPNGDIGLTSDTTLPSTRDLSTMTTNTQPFWVGLAA
jgi:hypothetical protein